MPHQSSDKRQRFVPSFLSLGAAPDLSESKVKMQLSLCGLTFEILFFRWLVERESERNQCRQLKDDEGDVLQRFPDQLQERLGCLRRDGVRAKDITADLQISFVATETCEVITRGLERAKQSNFK